MKVYVSLTEKWGSGCRFGLKSRKERKMTIVGLLFLN